MSQTLHREAIIIDLDPLQIEGIKGLEIFCQIAS